MTIRNKNLKVLDAMYEISNGKSIALNYEDIVVAVYRKYPADFHLRGYPEFPDATDINKHLYGALKKKGYVLSGGKQFQLTELGLRIAQEFKGGSRTGKERLPRDFEKEINRIKNSEGFKMFLDGKEDKLIDTDFYDYLAITVGTPKNLFLGKMNLIKAALDTLSNFNEDIITKKLLDFHQLMMRKFKNEIPKG